MKDQAADAYLYRTETRDNAPAFPPSTITVQWAMGDCLTVDYGDLAVWEAQAALRAAADLLDDGEESEEDDE